MKSPENFAKEGQVAATENGFSHTSAEFGSERQVSCEKARFLQQADAALAAVENPNQAWLSHSTNFCWATRLSLGNRVAQIDEFHVAQASRLLEIPHPDESSQVPTKLRHISTTIQHPVIRRDFQEKRFVKVESQPNQENHFH
jgi:hypothetical protein